MVEELTAHCRGKQYNPLTHWATIYIMYHSWLFSRHPLGKQIECLHSYFQKNPVTEFSEDKATEWNWEDEALSRWVTLGESFTLSGSPFFLFVKWGCLEWLKMYLNFYKFQNSMILYLSSPKYATWKKKKKATCSLLSPLQLIFLFVFNLQNVSNKSTVQQYCEGRKNFPLPSGFFWLV